MPKPKRKCVKESAVVLEPLLAYLRIRPLTQPEEKRALRFSDEQVYKLQSGKTVTITPPPSSAFHKRGIGNEAFSFTNIFGPDVNQKEVFDEMMGEPLRILLNKGLNVLVFAYGVTSSGKSYTMVGSQRNPGMVPRFVTSVFELIRGKQQLGPAVEPVSSESVRKISAEVVEERRKILDGFSCCESPPAAPVKPPTTDFEVTFGSYTVFSSYYEVYGNQLNDLLFPGETKLTIREMNGTPYIHGLAQVPCYSAKEVLECIRIGMRNLSIGSTKLNERSSRSHSIFSLTIICDGTAIEQTPGLFFARTAHFCDLAGSERAKKADGNEERFKEMCAINSSLLNLQRCIDILRLSRKPNNVVRPPYRSSKLTRLFQPFFEGRGVVRMMANVAFDPYLFDETVNVLKFCAIAQKVVLKRRAPNASQVCNLAQSGSQIGSNTKFNITEGDNPRMVTVAELINEINRNREEIEFLARDREDTYHAWIANTQELQDQHNTEMHAIEQTLTEMYNDELANEMQIFRKRFKSKYQKFLKAAAERLDAFKGYACDECRKKDDAVIERVTISLALADEHADQSTEENKDDEILMDRQSGADL